MKENKKIDSDIKGNEIFSFNLWLLINFLYISYLILLLVPHEIISKYIGINFILNRYWLLAIPTHFLVTVIYILIIIKGIVYIITDEPPVQIDKYHKKLSSNEMFKEILYNKEEGILPDIGDMDENIINKVLNSYSECDYINKKEN